MKLIRHGPPGAEKPGLVDIDGQLRDLSGHVRDVTGSVLDDRSLDRLRDVDPQSLPLVARDSRLGPCVGEVGKVVCVGLNYSDHAAETGAPTPKEPILFFKATSAISGPNDSVMIPRDSLRTDWEVELGIVIGSEVRYVEEADALSHVAGYCVVNDVSERDFQTKRGGQWVKGKSADTFCPLGPWLVTRDEVPDPQGLDMWLDVNGERRQDSSTSNMIFSAAFLVSYISRFMSLQAGDVIATGTPAGVGMGRNPQVWLA
ncbi:MAG: fumarylacetoacetate hydrolase family protein, partial [Rhodobacteraceae bacterium]|nr:fumarylacetoacetate hydrolase family protein [Paracoccaceae bacterium]